MNPVPLPRRPLRRRTALAVVVGALIAAALRFVPAGAVAAPAPPAPRKLPPAPKPGEPTAFVRRYLDAEARSTPTSGAPFFASRVDYYSHGQVSRAFVLRDQQAYRRRWPVRRYHLDGRPEELPAAASRGEVTVRYRLIYEASNRSRLLSGITLGEIRLRPTPGGGFEITAIRETAL